MSVIPSRYFYPSLMGLCASLLYAANPSFSPSTAASNRIIETTLILSGVFCGYYLASLKPCVRKSKMHFNTASLHQKVVPFLVPLLLVLIHPPPFTMALQFIFAGLLTLGYYLKWDTAKGIFGGLRSLPFLKNIILALAWALTTVPLSNESGHLLFLHRFLFLAALSIVIDLRDLEQDRLAALHTFPMHFDVRITRLAGVLLLTLSAFTGYLYTQKTQPDTLWNVILFSTVLTCLSIYLLRPNNSHTAFLLHIDGNLLLYSILTFVAYR
jgi:hypothetical protein